MRDGLYICSIPSGYDPYVLVGWVRRVSGDELEILGSRCMRRFGADAVLSVLANKGPQEDTQLLEASKVAVPLHRLHVVRPEPCNEKAWIKHIPKPKDWDKRIEKGGYWCDELWPK